MTLGGRGSSVPSLHTRDDFSCDTTSDDGSPVDPGDRATLLTGAQSGRRLRPTSFRFRTSWQRRMHARTSGGASV